METLRDINGREIRPGDVVRIEHYVDGRTRRKVYMYRIVVFCNDESEIDINGRWLFGVEPNDIPFSGLDDAFRNDLRGVKCEIIDGRIERMEDGTLQAWYERPKVKAGEGAK